MSALLAVAGTCATTVSAHPSGPRLTVAAYRDKANAICANERGQTMSAYKGSTTLPQYLDTEVPILGSALASLRKLVPPVQLASLHARIVNIVNSEVELFTFSQQEVRAGMLTVAQWQHDSRTRQLADRELSLWKKVGAKVCAR